MQTNRVMKPAIRYSEAFKIQIVSELERDRLTVAEVKGKYGIRGNGTVERWLCRLGNGTRGKIVRVEAPQEIDEMKRLKERVKRLGVLLDGAQIGLGLGGADTHGAR